MSDSTLQTAQAVSGVSQISGDQTDHDKSCGFCHTHVPAGATVCTGCGAEYEYNGVFFESVKLFSILGVLLLISGMLVWGAVSAGGLISIVILLPALFSIYVAFGIIGGLRDAGWSLGYSGQFVRR